MDLGSLINAPYRPPSSRDALGKGNFDTAEYRGKLASLVAVAVIAMRMLAALCVVLCALTVPVIGRCNPFRCTGTISPCTFMSCTTPGPSGTCQMNQCATDITGDPAGCPYQVYSGDCRRSGCDGCSCKIGMPWDADPACPTKAPPATVDQQHVQCNHFQCQSGACNWVGNPGATCSKYDWPPNSPEGPKDAQCWAPKCVLVQFGGISPGVGMCQGDAVDVDRWSCPIPVSNEDGKRVDAQCYYPACAVNAAGDKTGHCSENYFRSAGGREPDAVHAGNCLVPDQYSPKCYWPYCDHTGHCDGNLFTGIAPTKEGNWVDGTMGSVPVPYKYFTRPYSALGTVTIPGNQKCLVSESSDKGNKKYPQWNSDCFKPRCILGKCSGDPIRPNLPCNPVDGRRSGGYNEVFVEYAGDPMNRWQGITSDCVYYTCGYDDGDKGHCIQRNFPGNRTRYCSNSDNNKCTFDWCDGLGMCKVHEWKPGHALYGECATDKCDPNTGVWTYTRNGNVCCGNGRIDFGEQCEIGVREADAKCCKNCYLQTSCDDGNPCTTEKCVAGNCIPSWNESNAQFCPMPASADEFHATCRKMACIPVYSKDTLAECTQISDPTREDQPCGYAPVGACWSYACQGGLCTRVPANIGGNCVPEDENVTVASVACMRWTCQISDLEGQCLPTPDVTLRCDDADRCTINACAEEDGLGVCKQVGRVECPTAPQCRLPGICNATNGLCDYAPLPAGQLCPIQNETRVEGDLCEVYLCDGEGGCLRSCTCGNGRLDSGEECDWAMSAFSQKGCCSFDCKGCTCGNGMLDPDEECDYGIPSHFECCSDQCKGCMCGNGRIDPGEECDPEIQYTDPSCCFKCLGNCIVSDSLRGRIARLGGMISLIVSLSLLFFASLVSVAVIMCYRYRAPAPTTKPFGDEGKLTPSTNPMYVGRVSEHVNPLHQEKELLYQL